MFNFSDAEPVGSKNAKNLFRYKTLYPKSIKYEYSKNILKKLISRINKELINRILNNDRHVFFK